MPGKRALTDRPLAVPASFREEVDEGDDAGDGLSGEASTASVTTPSTRGLPFLQLRGVAAATPSPAPGAGQRPIDLQVHEPAHGAAERRVPFPW